MTTTKMTMADIALQDRDFKTILLTENFNIYCFKCNIMMRSGTLVNKYDAATYTHKDCPRTPLKTYAPHRYGGNK